jgi:hypothetical protein
MGVRDWSHPGIYVHDFLPATPVDDGVRLGLELWHLGDTRIAMVADRHHQGPN